MILRLSACVWSTLFLPNDELIEPHLTLSFSGLNYVESNASRAKFLRMVLIAIYNQRSGIQQEDIHYFSILNMEWNKAELSSVVCTTALVCVKMRAFQTQQSLASYSKVCFGNVFID